MVNFASAAAKAATGSATNDCAPVVASVRADQTSPSILPGSAVSARSKKLLRLRHVVAGYTLVEPSQTLKMQVHRVEGSGCLFRASRPSAATSSVFSAPASRATISSLHVEEIGERLVKPLGPEMIARFSVDELHVDAALRFPPR